MSNDTTQRWVLAYDIRDPKRLQRLWRYLRKEALPLQYSVYVLKGTRQQIEPIVQAVQGIMDERVDDVRLYPLTETTCIWGLGAQFDEHGNTLTDAALDALLQTHIDTATLTFVHP